MEGWIKIHRKITEWEWYSDPITKSVFFDLLLTANHEPRRYKGHDILIGQTISGYPAMAKRLGISVQNARTAINHLKSTGELTVQSTNRFSIITLLNYTKYQLTQNETNQQTNSPANSQLTVNQQSTNNTQELKNIRIKEKEELSKDNTANAEIPNQLEVKIKKERNPDIDKMLQALKLKIGIQAFVDSRIERNIAKHCVGLMEKIGRDEFVRRLGILLNDNFHSKNCNKILYDYNNIKGFIEPKPKINNSVFIS